MGVDRQAGVPRPKKRDGNLTEHLKQWVMLPADVDPIVWTRAEIWRAASDAEARSDAREGRFFDLTWPRELPTDEMDASVVALYQPFVDVGLAVQADWERSMASDGQFNDHLHGLLATRVLTNAGFASTKSREVDAWFRSGVRSHVAKVVNSIAEARNLAVRFDFRPNVDRDDALPPEMLLSRNTIRSRSASARAGRARRDALRTLRGEYEQVVADIAALEQRAVEHLAEIETSLDTMVVLTSLQGKLGDVLSSGAAIQTLARAGMEVTDWFEADRFGLVVVARDATFIDAGTRILVDGQLSADATGALLLLARRKGWRDLSLTDETGMPLPLPVAPPCRDAAHRMAAVRLDVHVRHGAVSAARWVGSTLRAGTAKAANCSTALRAGTTRPSDG